MNSYKPEGALISTHKNHEYISSKDGLIKALNEQVILEAPVVLCDHNFNLHVELCSGVKGIIPREEVQYIKDESKVKDIAILTRVGKIACFKVSGFKVQNSGESVAILSRRIVQKECIDNYISTLNTGDIIPAKVTHMEKFGAFVDIACGIISLLSIDCISVSRISHPSARLSVGDFIYTVVKGLDEKGRVFVSLRELLGTWEENISLFSEGQTVRGIVRSVESYGIFIELKPNLAGLAEVREGITPGQIAAVYIKSIIPDKMKIKLIIIDAEESLIGKEELEYFIDVKKTQHLDGWVYSPKSSKRKIESVF